MARFEYAPAPKSRAIVSIKESYGLFIGGEFTSSVDGRAFKTISPATEEVLAEVTEAGPADVDRAVAAARLAYERTWSGLPPIQRGKYLFRIARIIQANAWRTGQPVTGASWDAVQLLYQQTAKGRTDLEAELFTSP